MNTPARILVVDDDSGGRRLTRATLNRAGFHVTEAANGALALEAMRTELPDLVLMDVSMPVMDGFTATLELRALPGGARIPVVMMTGLEDVQSIARAFEVGATDFITKPINWTILAHRVHYMLRASAAINELKQNQRRLSNAQRIGEMGDWECDVASDRMVPSEQAWRIFGHDPSQGELSLEQWLAIVHEDDAPALREAWQQAVASGQPFAIDHRIVHPNGQLRHVHQQVEVTTHGADGGALHLAGAVHDITRHKEAEEQIRRLAHYDPLTGLPNRLLFTEQLQKALSLALRHGRQAAIMFVDLDHFKRVNDTLGHNAGDELLRVVAKRLSSSLRSNDSVTRGSVNATQNSIARLGGDEFIVLLTEISEAADAAAVARRIVAALAEPVTVQGTEIFVGASIGVAMYPCDGEDIDTLLMHADTAMYRAKAAGRGGFQFYDRSMNAQALERLQMEARLRRALDRNEFVLHYQPRVDVRTGRILSAEGLIRWQHPERGIVPPGEFIKMAEDTGLVMPIGEWAINVACRQVAQWRGLGLGVIPVAVNLASTHLQERGLPALVAAALRRHGVPASSLELEVTESILMTEPELSIAIAGELAAMGVRMSIDDFGTGYSSLSYLKRLPIDALKIDRSFVRDLETDPDDEAIVSAIIVLAHALKLKVVAEGVETPAQLAFLKSRHCDEYQGFLSSRAVTPEEFALLLREHVERPLLVGGLDDKLARLEAVS
jgi:diguanylate cyclase (GGDEF)-like protein/PAS domain S-box-containing protein